ncbi:hypothetical protein NMY22_g19617 [Coprinellus aureogranulatus]|nr:hypothetical protein NMY22_g19617 [Coprinellus aureogranulatus]
MRRVWGAERDVNVQASSNESRALGFYLRAIASCCPGKDESGDSLNCQGNAVYRIRRDKKKSFDGKKGFVGCSNYAEGQSKSHRFMPIPLDIMEELVERLFKTAGKAFGPDVSASDSQAPNEAQCARILHPSVGKKGKAKCDYPHVRDGMAIVGRIVHQDCPNTVHIWAPVDRTDRQAIIIIDKPHNHPMFPPVKASREAKERYREAVEELQGTSNLTVLNVDKAPSTSRIFGNQRPEEFDAALANTRVKRDIVSSVKNKSAPLGTSIAGVLNEQNIEKTIPKEQRYIHKVIAEPDFSMVITMLQGLCKRMHDAEVTLHDNTYKLIHGEWIQWECVLFDLRLNMRITFARIFCTRETTNAFKRMWGELWNTIESITERPVRFKFMDGSGLKAILVDGCKAQVSGLGSELIERAAKRGQVTLATLAPDEIVQKILRTCIVHLERKFDEMAKTLPKDVMDRVRLFRFIETKEELDEFVKWCLESPHKVVKDWMADKVPHSWFVPSVNEFMTQIPREDWYSSPQNTNLNEGAHPHTNMHTGINLSILEAVRRTKQLDMQILRKVEECEKNCVLVNRHNTQNQRDSRNERRREAHARASAKRAEASAEIAVLDEEAERLKEAKNLIPAVAERTAAQRKQVTDINARLKEITALKNAIFEEKGIRRSPQKSGARGKARQDYQDHASGVLTDGDLPDWADGNSEPELFLESNGSGQPDGESSGLLDTHFPLSQTHLQDWEVYLLDNEDPSMYYAPGSSQRPSL